MFTRKYFFEYENLQQKKERKIFLKKEGKFKKKKTHTHTHTHTN